MTNVFLAAQNNEFPPLRFVICIPSRVTLYSNSFLFLLPVDFPPSSNTNHNHVICMIPWYRTDNKFSSFVRQLNFYGFRKVKAHVSAVDDADAKWWEFKVGFYHKGVFYYIQVFCNRRYCGLHRGTGEGVRSSPVV